LLDERFVAADIVDVIEVTELLQQGHGVGAAPQPVAVVAHRPLTGGRFDHRSRLDQELLLLVTTHRVLRAPARTVTGRLVAARDDFPAELRMAPDRFADHMGSDLDSMAIPEIEHAWDSLAVAIGEPGIGSGIGGHAGREIHL